MILAADFDRSASGNSRIVNAADIAAVMKAIRRQRGDAAETDNEIDEAMGRACEDEGGAKTFDMGRAQKSYTNDQEADAKKAFLL